MPIDSVHASPTIKELIGSSRLSLDDVCRRAKISMKSAERIRKGEAVKLETYFRFITALDGDPTAYLDIGSFLKIGQMTDTLPNEQLVFFKDDRTIADKKVYMDPFEHLEEENVPTECLFKIDVINANDYCVNTITETVESLNLYYQNTPSDELEHFSATHAIEKFKKKNVIDTNIEQLKSYDVNVYSAQWVHWIGEDIKSHEGANIGEKIGENWWRTNKIGFYLCDRIQSRNVAAIVNECHYPPLWDQYPDGKGTFVDKIRRKNEPTEDDLPF